MFPTLLDLGTVRLPVLGEVHLTLPTYGAVFALGAIAAWWWFTRRGRTLGVDPEVLFNLGFWSLIAGLLGAKAALVAVEWRYYLENPWDILGTVRSAGVLLGGVLAGVVTFVLYARRHDLPTARLADAAAAPLALGQAVGRLGCLAAGCCYGVPAAKDNPFAIVLEGVARVPIQLIQFTSDLVLAGVLTVLWRRSRRPGVTACAYLVLYGISRAVLEGWRGDAVRGLWLGGHVSTSQILGLAGALIGALALGRVLRRGIPEDRA